MTLHVKQEDDPCRFTPPAEDYTPVHLVESGKIYNLCMRVEETVAYDCA